MIKAIVWFEKINCFVQVKKKDFINQELGPYEKYEHQDQRAP